MSDCTGSSSSSALSVPATVAASGGDNHKKKQPRQILSEELYQATLATIVQRDYFPALPSLHRDLAVLERRAVGDVAGAVAVRRAYRRVAEEEEKAAQAEREEDDRARMTTSSSGGSRSTTTAASSSASAVASGMRKRPRPLERESITGFHDRAISEDNEEYCRVSQKEQSEQRDRMRKLYAANLGRGQQALLLQNEQKAGTSTDRNKIQGAETPLLPASEQFDAPAVRIADASVKSDTSNTNALFFVPEHYPHRERNHDTKNDNASDPMLLLENGNGPNDPMNKSSSALMLPPPPRPKGSGKPSGRDNVSIKDLVEYKPKPQSDVADVGIPAVPTINPAMTRFPHQGESRLPPASSVRRGQFDNMGARAIGVTTSPSSTSASDTDATTDLNATPMSIAGERAARAEALRREREQFVTMTPVILPGMGAAGGETSDDPNATPITTWGTLAGDPMALSRQTIGTGKSLVPGPTAGPAFDGADDEDDSSSSGVQVFSLPSEDTIEQVAKFAESRLADRAKIFKDAQTNKGIVKATKRGTVAQRRTPSSSLQNRTKSLTPAARALLARTTPKSSGLFSSGNSTSGGKVSARSSSALASALRASYTSTPRTSSKRRATASRGASAATPGNGSRNAVPDATTDTSRSVGKQQGNGNITDGLLNM